MKSKLYYTVFTDSFPFENDKNVDLDIFLDINKDNDTFIREINYQQMRLDKNSERKTSLLLCLD